MVQADVDLYIKRASQLIHAMALCADDLPTYTSAVALLAVHSAISYCDVFLLSLTGSRSTNQDHMKAAALARKACRSAKLEPVGIIHLEKLLSAKTQISYGDQHLAIEYAQALAIRAERFQAWVEKSIAGRTTK